MALKLIPILVSSSFIAIAIQSVRQGEPKLWKIDTGLSPVRLTVATWKTFGPLGRFANLPINSLDRSGLAEEAEIRKALALHRNDPKYLSPYATKYKASKSAKDLQRYLIAMSAISEGGKEMPSTYRSTAEVNFGLAEYLKFRETVGSDLNILEARMLIQLDNTFFDNPRQTYAIFKKLQAKKLEDRRVSFSVISKVMDSYLQDKKNSDLVPELYKLAEKLYVQEKTPRSINTFAGAMLAMGVLKKDKALYYKALSMSDPVRRLLENGDPYDRKSQRDSKSDQEYWISKGKEIFK